MTAPNICRTCGRPAKSGSETWASLVDVGHAGTGKLSLGMGAFWLLQNSAVRIMNAPLNTKVCIHSVQQFLLNPNG